MSRHGTPEAVPLLSPGKHRSPRKGACFMEYASFLAGERWSDHPRCTHPLLAGVARGVNDTTSDSARSRLIGLIPSVIGLTSDDPRMDARIAVRCAATALPVVAEHRQRVLAVGLLAARRLLSDLDGGTSLATETIGLFDHSQRALAAVPQAARWAEELVDGRQPTSRAFQRRSAPTVVRVAVIGIAEACIPDPDILLYELLTTVMRDFTHWRESGSAGDSATAGFTLPVVTPEGS